MSVGTRTFRSLLVPILRASLPPSLVSSHDTIAVYPADVQKNTISAKT